jgi:putative ABC transport system permease protein
MESSKAEATLMNARGAGPGTISAIAVLESLVPVLAGLVVGMGLAYGAIVLLGPGGTIERAALDDSIRQVAIRGPVALALIAVVAAIAFARDFRTRHDHHRSFPLPWELVALAFAGWFLYRLLHGDAVVVQSDGVERPSAYLLLFPILAIAGIAGLAARVFVRLARVWRRRTTRRSGPAAYLAAHRLAAARRLLLVLVTACAVAFGLFIYAQVVVTSYRATIDAAALLALGSDVRGLTSFDREAPLDDAIPTTKATRIQAGGSTLLDRVPTYFLAIDPKTFEQAVHWEDDYADEPLADILARLDEGGPEIPVLVVQGNSNAERLIVDSVDVPFRVVATAKAFPGMAKESPLVVASEDAVEAEFDRQGVGSPLAASSASTQILAKGDPEPAIKLLEGSPARPYPIVTAQELARRPSVTAFTRTFSFLQALGLVAGLLGLVGLVVYMQARARARSLAYGFAHRMGLSARAHRRALLIELGLALLLSFALAVSLAALAARLVLTRVEPIASISPVPLVRLPGLVFVGVAAILALVAIVGAFVAHRSAARANLAEVLRLGD